VSNPRYVDDPDFYERPGETVHLTVDQQPSQFRHPGLPWRAVNEGPYIVVAGRRIDYAELAAPKQPCMICQRETVGRICQYCARAQARDETAKARANIPQPSTPRIAVKEAWESWAESQPKAEPDLESGHVRAYETRIG